MATKQILVAGEVESTPKNPLGIAALDLGLISKMPMSRYFSFRDRIVGARSQVWYDTVRLEAGSNWTSAQKVRLFTVGRESASTVANTGTAIIKSDFDTNMSRGGEFESNVTAIIEAVEVQLDIPARLATADSSGLVSNPAPAAKAANTFSATLLHKVLTNQTRLTFYRGETPEENGLLNMFPTRFGAAGVIGGDTEEGMISNYAPGGSMLDFPKVFETNNDLSVLLEPLAPAVAMPSDIAIRVLLIGKRIGAY